MKVIAEGITALSAIKIAIRMNDTTGIDFIKVTAGAKSLSAIFDQAQRADSRTAAGIAARMPADTRKSERVEYLQNSAVAESSSSLLKVRIGVGRISGLPTAIAAICQSASQKRATPVPMASFLINLIYPKILSSGIAPPIEVGTCS